MKVQLIIAIMVFLLMVGICSAGDTTSGFPPYTIKEGTVSGGLYSDSYYYCNDQPTGPKTISKTFTLPSYDNIKWAMLLTTVYCGHMENNYPGWANVTFNDIVQGNESLNVNFSKGNGNVTVVNDHVNRVTSDYLIWYNVTDLIQEEDNTAVVHTEKNGTSSFDGRIKLITLVLAYDDSSSKKIYYWFNKGHDTDIWYPPDSYIGSTIFTADLPSGITVQDVTLKVVHMASEDGSYTFNSNSISSGTPQGDYSGSNIWDVTSIFNPNGINTLTYDRVGGYYKIILGILTAEIDMRMCGDVDKNGAVNILDVRLLMNNVSQPGYPIDSWTGDVTGDGNVNSDDIQLLVMHIFDSDTHLLNCGCD